MSGTAAEPAVGVYVHWPFCRSKCPYCDFNSHVAERVDLQAWRDALAQEIDWFASRTTGAVVATIFFGGGTPSLMPPETVDRLLRRIRRRWSVADDAEITLEANPTSVEAERFAALTEAGINRVSLGVQALNDEALAFLGRGHSVREALNAVAVARRHFDRTSFDLIYARPGQTAADWRAELTSALDHVGDHLSVYQLTIEPGTQFHTRHARGEISLPDDDAAGALYEATQAVLEDAGLPAYEISNHARPGTECRHNLNYWRSGQYIGVGPGAHGRIGHGERRRATRQIRAPELWLKSVAERGHGTQDETELTAPERRDEMVMMGLRTVEGIPRRRFRRELGCDVEAAIEPARLAPLIAGGFVTLDDERLAATAAGRQRLSAVLARLLA
jgi:oxygen-independent coproporphyrinogen-3 oxidase